MQSELGSLIVPAATRPSFEVAVPGSKSLSNRALVVAALATGRTLLEGTLSAEDTEVMKESLRRLGFSVEEQGDRIAVEGGGGAIPRSDALLDLRLSGTSIRFLSALVALGHGQYSLDGNERMRERPIGDLLAALRSLGADVTAAGGNQFPPVTVRAAGLTGGRAEVAGDRSSQFLSALLMVAPYALQETTLEVTGSLQSKPFVDMTIGLMADFGVTVQRDEYRSFTVRPGTYLGRKYQVEGDAMAAGYFWAGAAVSGGSVRVTNVGRRSSQGDKRLAEVLGEMGCSVEWGEDWCTVSGPRSGVLQGGKFDLNDMPDQAQTLAVVALFADSAVEIDNVWNLRIKETDRLRALAEELGKFGAHVEERHAGLRIEPPTLPRAAQVSTYGDHRMAMAFAVAGLRLAGTEISDPGCVAKTYPGFFEDWRDLAASGSAQ